MGRGRRADFRKAGGRIPGFLPGGFSASQPENFGVTGNNKIAFGPLDEGPARCGTILAAAGIGQKGEINI